MPANCSISSSSLTFFFFTSAYNSVFSCYSPAIILKYILTKQNTNSKGGKIVYSSIEAEEIICMDSDSKGNDIDLADEFENLHIDPDWEGDDAYVKSSKVNHFESNNDETDYGLLIKRKELLLLLVGIV